jgi:hypothetical protein
MTRNGAAPLAAPSTPPAARRASALLGAAVAASVVLGGCGPAGSGSLGPAPLGSAAPSPSTSPSAPAVQAARPQSPPAAARTLTVQIWLVRNGRLFAASRTRPAQITTGRLALAALTAGPSDSERTAGVSTEVPAGSAFGLSLAHNVATVVPPAGFYGGGRDAARMRQAQVVYTLTQFPTIRSVFFDTGTAEPAAAVTRPDYAGLLPPIVVVAPSVGARVSSPVVISGTANVYEATVSVRILDGAGAEIATRFTNATSGSGTRGTYSVAVPFPITREQTGMVEVFEVSARDGSRVNAVRIPVTLLP